MKNFVYLDDYKMYSLSSQLMEGVTDYIVKESGETNTDTEDQKIGYASGRRMAEIIETTSSSIEKRFLHDYAYTIFESRLSEMDKILELDATSTFDKLVSDPQGRRIVKIVAKAHFLDAADMLESLNSLVEVQESLSVVSHNEQREAIVSEIESLGTDPGKKARLAHLKRELDALSKSQISRDRASNDKLYYKNLSSFFEHGFKSRLDLKMGLSDCKVTADLKRNYLKDPEAFVFKTYSRLASVELVMLGVATQYISPKDEVGEGDEDEAHDEEYGDSIAGIVAKSAKARQNLDDLFSRVGGKQIVVDPIAIYLQL